MDQLLIKGSYLGIILFLVLTGCGLPVPEEVPIIFAGVMSAKASLNIWLALASCIIGAVLGDSMMYWFGHHFGRSGLAKNRFMAKIITPEREAHVEQLIQRHGLKVFLTIRFLAGVRAPIYVTCGIMKVPYRKFLLADAISASVVVSVVFWLSYFIGDRIQVWIRDVEYALTALAAFVGLGIAAFFVIRYQRRKTLRELQGLDEGDNGTPADEAAEASAGEAAKEVAAADDVESDDDSDRDDSQVDQSSPEAAVDDQATPAAAPRKNGSHHAKPESKRDRSAI